MYNIYNPIEMTEEQKLIYVRLLIYLAKSDNNPDYIEKRFIKNIIDRFQLSPTLLQNLSVPNKLDDLYVLLRPIRERAIAIDLLHCLRFAASVDSIIDEEEVKIIRTVAHILDIDDDTLLVINNFVFDEMIFLKQACDVLETEEVRC